MIAHRMRSAIRYMAEQAAEQWAQPRMGLLTSYDPTSGSVKVQLQPENVETGWLPLMPLWQGNGWGFFAPPPVGSQVVVIFQEGHPDNGVCLGAIPSDDDRPLPVPAGEAWLQHQSGAGLKLTNDGTATYMGARGQALTLAADGTANLTDSSGGMLTLANGVATITRSGATPQPVMLADGSPSTTLLAG